MADGPITSKDERVVSFFEKITRIWKQVEMISGANPSLNGERYMTDKELSAALKISRYTLWEYRNQGILPYYEIGGKILYRESDIEKVMREHYFESFPHRF